MMHVPTSQWAKPCRNIRGLQLSQAGKTVWNLPSCCLERMRGWKTMRIVFHDPARTFFCCLPRGRAKLRVLSVALRIWFLRNCLRSKTMKLGSVETSTIHWSPSRCWRARGHCASGWSSSTTFFFGMSIWTNSNRQITRPWRDIWWLKSTGWKWEDGYGSTPDPCAPPESWVWYSLPVYTYIIVHYSAYNILYLFVLNVMYRMFVWCELNAMSCFKDSRWWANSIGFDSMISAYHSIIFPKIMQLWPFASYNYLQPHLWNVQSHV